MLVRSAVLCLLAVSLATCCKKPDGQTPCPTIFDRGLATGYGMGVNSSGGLTKWLTSMGDSMKMAYPSGQQWGAVFITYGGDPRNPPRPGIDLSRCETLEVELRGETGGESLAIGIKDNTDPDDGSEARAVIECNPTWTTHRFPLSAFNTADLARIYVVAEFVFNGGKARTVYFRNVRYSS